jgi:hypothetical protein
VGGATVSTGNGVVGTGVQRVAIASDNTAFSVNSTLAAETTKVIGTINVAAAQVISVEQQVASKLLATVTNQAITKGTQGTTGVTVQDLKDAGRSARNIILDSFAVAATAETLMSMSVSTDNAAPVAATSYSVTAGKRLRVQQITASLHTIAGNTTAVNVIVRIRVNNAGAAIVSSPIQFVLPIQGVAAANQAGLSVNIPIPDGWELVAGAGLGVTVACSGFVATTAAPKVDIAITGYEY